MKAASRLRTWAVVIVLVIVFGGLYAGVVGLFAANNRSGDSAACPAPTDLPADEMTVALNQQSVDAAGQHIGASLDLLSFGPLTDGNGDLKEPVSLLLSNVQTSRTLNFSPGQLPSPQNVTITSLGDVENWPFDRYTARLSIIAVTGAGTAEQSVVPLNVCRTAHVPGWSLTSTEVTASSELFTINGQPADELVITASRSLSTVLFGVVVLAAMVFMPVLALIVGISVLRGRRKAEATLMSWFAALLFATIPLRNFLPGSPPIGSWVDYLIVLWVVVGLAAALVVYVIAWMRWAPAGDGSARHPAARKTAEDAAPPAG